MDPRSPPHHCFFYSPSSFSAAPPRPIQPLRIFCVSFEIGARAPPPTRKERAPPAPPLALAPAARRPQGAPRAAHPRFGRGVSRTRARAAPDAPRLDRPHASEAERKRASFSRLRPSPQKHATFLPVPQPPSRSPPQSPSVSTPRDRTSLVGGRGPTGVRASPESGINEKRESKGFFRGAAARAVPPPLAASRHKTHLTPPPPRHPHPPTPRPRRALLARAPPRPLARRKRGAGQASGGQSCFFRLIS